MSEAFEKIRQTILANDGAISFSQYMDICLYDDSFGYYRVNRKRVGGDDADFYTSVSLKNKVFGELMQEAATNILKANNANPLEFNIVEIGAEDNRKIIENSTVFGYGEEVKIPQNCVLISNELIDARPFSRFVFDNGKWREIFVGLSSNSEKFIEIFKDAKEEDEVLIKKYFPKCAVEGFKLEVSRDAMKLLDNLCARDWRGVIIFADYFRNSGEISELAQGTARTYRNHKDGNDFLSNPSQFDITYSPCSDIFEDILRLQKFRDITTLTQEAFFVKHAGEKIRKIISSPNPFDSRKRELCQLLNPAQMGVAFRVTSGARL